MSQQPDRWEAVPGPQADFLASTCFEVLLARGRYGMGTDSLLALMLTDFRRDPRDRDRFLVPPRFMRPGFRALYLVPTKDEVEPMVERALAMWAGAGAARNPRVGRNSVVFPAAPGEQPARASFGYQPTDAARPGAGGGGQWMKNPIFLGRPFDLVAVDDLQEVEEALYRAWVQRLADQPLDRRCRVRATAHPDGAQAAWVKQRFARWLDPRHERPLAAGEHCPADVGDTTRSRQVFRSTVEDNPHHRAGAVAEALRAYPEPRRARQYEGRWDVPDAAPEQAEDHYSPHALAAYRGDPEGFVTRYLKRKGDDGVLAPVRLWSKQRGVLRALARGVRKLALKSGQKTGKTLLIAVIVLWWVFTRPRAKVIITSSTGRQVKGQVWSELSSLARDMDLPLPRGAKQLGIDPGTGLTWDDGRFIIGFSTDDASNMGGWSSPELFVVADESSGVARKIFEALEGNLIGGGVLAMFGNPVEVSGYFYEAFTDAGMMSQFERVTVDSRENPNCTGDEPPIAGLALPEMIASLIAAYGEESPVVAVRVKGQFPRNVANAVVPLGLVEDAKRRYLERADDDEYEMVGVLQLGVDVARFGDDKPCVRPRRGQDVLPKLPLPPGIDTMQLCAHVLAYVLANREPGEVVLVKVDVVGVGAGVADRLRELELLEHREGGKVVRRERVMRVYDVHAGSRSDDPEQYPNLRSQLWFAAADFLRDGGSLPPDPALEGELVAPVYRMTARAQREVESKDETKAKIRRSPDDADALALCVYTPRRAGPATRERGGPVGEALESRGVYGG